MRLETLVYGPNENSQQASMSVYVLAYNPDWVSDGKQAAEPVHGERANFTRLKSHGGVGARDLIVFREIKMTHR